MGNYQRQNDFSAKDSLTTGNPDKIIKGSDVDDELDAVKTAVNSKIDAVSGHTTDNLAKLNASGEVADSGFSTDDFLDLIPLTRRTADVTSTESMKGKVQYWTDETSAARTFTLEAASTYDAGYYLWVLNGSAYDLTIAPNGTDEINDVNSNVTVRAGQGGMLVRDTTTQWNWIKGGGSKLDDINDVDASSPSNGEVLAWNNSNSAWEPAAASVTPGADSVTTASIDYSFTGGNQGVTNVSPWVVPEGIYMATPTGTGNPVIEVQVLSTWYTSINDWSGGMLISDGTNTRISNPTAATTCQVWYLKLD